MAWELTGDKAVYLQVMEEIQIRIISGIYPSGSKLPSVRDLAAEARVNPNTMQRAMAELERDDLIFSQRTTGKYVTCDTNKIAAVRDSMAKQSMTEFVDKMRKLGFNRSETLSELTEFCGSSDLPFGSERKEVI